MIWNFIYESNRSKGWISKSILKIRRPFVGLKDALVENAELHVPDFDAAMRPEESKRPFELYVDTCDRAWVYASPAPAPNRTG